MSSVWPLCEDGSKGLWSQWEDFNWNCWALGLFDVALQSELNWRRGGPHHCHQDGCHLKPWPTAQGNGRNYCHGNFQRGRAFIFQSFGLGDLLSQQLKKRQNSSCISEEGISWGRKCWILFICLWDGNSVWFCCVTFPCTFFWNHNSLGIYSDFCLPSPDTQEGRDVKFFLSLGLWRHISLSIDSWVLLIQHFCAAGAHGKEWGRRKTHLNCRSIVHLGCSPTATWTNFPEVLVLGEHWEITGKAQCRWSLNLPSVWQ